MTHDELVERARRWLVRSHPVVSTEVSTAAFENPDAIGFTSWGGSTLVECKTSRADFRADAKKRFRRIPEQGMARLRYYMAEPGLLTVEDLPTAWGLLEVHGRQVRVVARALPQKASHYAEQQLLVSLLRRVPVDAEGLSVKLYTLQTQCKATLTTLPEDTHE